MVRFDTHNPAHTTPPATFLLTFYTGRVIRFVQNVYRRRDVWKEDRPFTGDAPPACAEGFGAGAAARARRLGPHRADNQGGVSGQAGVSVPGPAPYGGGGLARIVLGRVGEQPPREVLLPHQSRAAPTRRGDGGLEARLRRHHERPQGDLEKSNDAAHATPVQPPAQPPTEGARGARTRRRDRGVSGDACAGQGRRRARPGGGAPRGADRAWGSRAGQREC